MQYPFFYKTFTCGICFFLLINQGFGADDGKGNCGGSITPNVPNIHSETFYQEQQKQIINRIEACTEARNNNTPSSIIDFYCPSNDTTYYEDQKALTPEVIYYNIAVETIFQVIDTQVTLYMKGLQCERNPNVYNWRESINTTIRGTGDQEGFEDLYMQACEFNYIQNILHYQSDAKNPIPLKYTINTVTTYPQSICRSIAEKKANAWDTMGNILMSDGVPKAIQNDKDRFLDKVKGSYKILLDKIHNLLMIIDRATSKITGNNANTVR